METLDTGRPYNPTYHLNVFAYLNFYENISVCIANRRMFIQSRDKSKRNFSVSADYRVGGFNISDSGSFDIYLCGHIIQQLRIIYLTIYWQAYSIKDNVSCSNSEFYSPSGQRCWISDSILVIQQCGTCGIMGNLHQDLEHHNMHFIWKTR